MDADGGVRNVQISKWQIALPGEYPGPTAIAKGIRGYPCEVRLRGLVAGSLTRPLAFFVHSLPRLLASLAYLAKIL